MGEEGGLGRPWGRDVGWEGDRMEEGQGRGGWE